MTKQVVGRCSQCGGEVTVPSIWHGVEAPKASCSRCHAIQSNQHLPIIPMEKRVIGDQESFFNGTWRVK